MFTYKRRIPPLLIIDGTTIAPAFVLAGRTRRRDQKRQEQIDLHAWESEGGNPALRTPLCNGPCLQKHPKETR